MNQTTLAFSSSFIVVDSQRPFLAMVSRVLTNRVIRPKYEDTL